MPRYFLIPLLGVGSLLVHTGCGPSEPVTYRVPAESRPSQPNETPGRPVQPPAEVTGSVPAPFAPPGSSENMEVLPGMTDSIAGFNTPQWQAPDHWIPKPLGTVRRGSFDIRGTDGQIADMAITVFPGDVGGVVPNINRWRAQLGLGPIQPDEVSRISVPLRVDGRDALLMLIEGSVSGGPNSLPQSTLGAFVFQLDATWFFKMTGDHPLVAAEFESFRTFMGTVRFTGDE